MMFSFEQLKFPLIQAPMAGGPNTPAMVSKVVSLGAVGSYGFAYSNAETISRDIKAARKLVVEDSAGAMNINFFVFDEIEVPESFAVDSVLKSLGRVARQNEFTLPAPPYFPNLSQQLEPVWALRPEILSFHFGIPDNAIILKARSMGIAVGITATSVAEAQKIEQAGANFIVAQGIEAGGHRGVFNPDGADNLLPTFELLKALSGKTNLPLVAAGGIMTSNDIKQALALGATAVQMGTAFLATQESGATDQHKHYLLNEQRRTTEITRGFSGRPARGINNRFIEEMADKPVLSFPVQNSLTGEMRARAVANADGEFQSLWAGTNFARCREESIAELITRLFPEFPR